MLAFNDERVDQAHKMSELMKKMTARYFENLNSGIVALDCEYNVFNVPVVSVESVKINMLSDIDAQVLEISKVDQTVKARKAIKPLVRIAISDELFDDMCKDTEYFKKTMTNILLDVQKSWETKFGSFKTQRYGKSFMTLNDGNVFQLNPVGVYFDIKGHWASTEEVL